MSRFIYDDDFDYDRLAAGRWLRNMKVCVEGKRGQAALRQMEAALLALPAPRLIEGHLATEDGDVCAVGAFVAYKANPEHPEEAAKQLAVQESAYLNTDEDDYIDPDDSREFTLYSGEGAGLTHTLAYMLGDLNDVTLDCCTPEERFRRVLVWVRARIK